MAMDSIDPQLMQDCHYLGHYTDSDLLLHRNGSLPWFILVPDTRLADVLDLPEEHRNGVLTECAGISLFIKQVLGFEKVNFAGLGNVVPQMHLHVLGRHSADPCWPDPVWGRLPDGAGYSQDQLLQWQQGLEKIAGLSPSPVIT